MKIKRIYSKTEEGKIEEFTWKYFKEPDYANKDVDTKELGIYDCTTIIIIELENGDNLEFHSSEWGGLKLVKGREK